MRRLGIDFGFTRIGVAVGESEVGIVSPRPTLAASGALKTDAAAIAAVARKEEVSEIVLGLPIEESGDEGKMARICRTLAGHLEVLGWVVRLVDESYTSLEAERALANAGVARTRWKSRKDGEAACLILERYIDGENTP